MRSSRMLQERGAVLPLTAVMLLGLLAVAALVVDGGVLFAARRDLQGMADGAARAGAMAVDEDLLRGEGTVKLDPAGARDAAAGYLEGAGFEGDVQIDAELSSVTVDLDVSQETLMMGLLGVRSIGVTAHAVARPRVGIDEAGE